MDIVVDTDYIRNAMGDEAEEFIEVMKIVSDIIENPFDLWLQSNDLEII